MNMEDNKVIKIETKGREIISVGKMPFLYGMLATVVGVVVGLISHLGSIPCFIVAGWLFAGGWPLESPAQGQSATQSEARVTRPQEPTPTVTRPPEPAQVPPRACSEPTAPKVQEAVPNVTKPVIPRGRTEAPAKGAPTPKQGAREEYPGDKETLQAPRPRPKRKRE